jgi:hypothetical protein
LSFDVVFETYKRTEAHIKKQPIKVPYKFVMERREKACKLFEFWLNVYKLFAEGYKKEILTWSTPYVVQNLSIFGNILEEKLVDVFQAKIPVEIYILLHATLGDFKPYSDFYIVAEGDSFEERSIYDEIYKQSLKKLHAPRPVERHQFEQMLCKIQENDMALLYYERGQYDNALSWPLLIHEGLHWLYNNVGLKSFEEKFPNRSPWINEVLIDMYVTNLFGPAYATSLASYLYRYPHEETLSHPHFIVRLYTCSKYLADLTHIASLPMPLKNDVHDAINYIEQVQNRHEDIVKEIGEQVDQIYNKACEFITRLISGKTKPFTSFIQDIELEKEKVPQWSPKEYPTKEVFSISDVQLYYELGIPIAAHPKVLFNSFISKQYLTGGVNTLFIKESLKKWYINKIWKERD